MPGARDAVRRQPDELDAAEMDAAGVGAVMPADDVDERRFPRAVGTEDADDLALADFEIDAVQRADALERFAQSPHRQAGFEVASHRSRVVDLDGAIDHRTRLCVTQVGMDCPLGLRDRVDARRRDAGHLAISRRIRRLPRSRHTLAPLPVLRQLPAHQRQDPVRHEQHRRHQDRAADRLARDGLVRGRRRVEQHGDDDGAKRGTRPQARAAEHAHQDHRQRNGDVERAVGGDVRHEQRLDASRDAGERAGNAERRELVAIGRHAHHFRRVLVVVDREQPDAEARLRNGARDHERDHGERERHHVERSRHRRRQRRNRDRGKVHARAAVDRRVEHDGGEHEGHREREQREHLAAHAPQAKHHRAQRHADQRGEQRRRRQRPQERHVELAGEHRGRVHADAEERAVAEREIAAVARQDVPRRRQHDPVQHDVEERLVERRQAQERNGGERDARTCDRDERAVGLQARPGRSSSNAISSVNETIGAHDGDTNAMVTASLTPITMPAVSGPSAEPSPPSITAANTTPTHA